MHNIPVNKIRYTVITVVLETGKRSYLLGSQNTVLKNATLLGLRTRRNTATRRSIGGKVIANNANFDSATLNLKIGSEEPFEDLFFEHIEQATIANPAMGFRCNYTNIDWDRTFIELQEGVTIDNGAVLELTIEFVENK